ncbi:hypothetical protein P8C59_001545 [Phyllachora maydis]|uniref:Uncharacterized protein n=1 Tax=Phyllachora maydis TaxID=1825666 RepID=A0AAD9HZL8_9PEZI|nr:hypothetical protein P8C59_001545 [Phyllachora maydis]
MPLKRKCSDSELSFSSGSTFSSPTRPDSAGRFDAALGSNVTRTFTPASLSGRTRKRFRDNRPSESTVYQHTLDLLYGAQRQLQHQPESHSPALSPGEASADPARQQRTQGAATPSARPPSGQPSLHNFWALPAQTRAPSAPPSSSPAAHRWDRLLPTTCEDCGVSLAGAGAGAMDMDMDGYAFGWSPGDADCVCGACGKAVCAGCSVSNLGSERRCLVCA